MKSKNDILVDEAMEAIRKLFSDTSVSKNVTKQNLESLVLDIEIVIDSLET